MTTEEFKTFTEEVIPQQLFHVDPTDIDDESGAKLEEVILVKLIAGNPSCLKHKSLQWFLDKFLVAYTEEMETEFNNHLQGQIEDQMKKELEEQFLENDMISSEDIFPSTEEEWFRQIEETEKLLDELNKSDI